MGYALMYPNLLPYICAQVYPRTDVILKDIVSEYNSPAVSVSCLYHMKLRGGLNTHATPVLSAYIACM